MSKLNRQLILLLTATLLTFAPGGSVSADTPAIQTMAEIVIKLKHTPEEGDKQQLQQIIAQGSYAERTIAEALLHLNHSATPAHKARLREISKSRDFSISMKARTLAKIVEEFDHKASAVDKMVLRGLK